MARNIATSSLGLMLVLALAACGGGSGAGEQLNSAPPPPPAPAPSPTPAPAATTTPLPPGPIGLQSERPFATVSAFTDGWGTVSTQTDVLKITYSPEDARYTVTVPTSLADVQPGAVTLDSPSSSPFTYTSFGSWYRALPMGEIKGVFAYGIPTTAAEVPRTGSATYAGAIRGVTNGDSANTTAGIGPILAVSGSVLLSFDFEAATLTGHMSPVIAPVSGAVSLGTYEFRDTSYSTGNTSFSGAFLVPGSSAASSFFGSFTGPQAAELMANWQAPFRNPTTGGWETMMGVWIARKGN